MKAYLKIATVILVITALAKLSSVAGSSQLLSVADPVLGTSFSTSLLFAAAIELIVAAICLFRSAVDGLVAVAWLSTVFLTYRVALWWTGWQKPCSCLGNLTDALHISPELADNVMKGLLAFMFIGSVSLLILHCRQGRAGSTSPKLPTAEPTQA